MEMQHPGVKVNTSNLVSYRVQGPCNPTSASRTQPFRGTEQSISFPTTIYKKRKLQDKLGCRKGNTIIKNIKKHEGPEFSNVQLTYTRFSWVNTCQDNHMAASCLSSAKLSFNNPNLNDNREKKKKADQQRNTKFRGTIFSTPWCPRSLDCLLPTISTQELFPTCCCSCTLRDVSLPAYPLSWERGGEGGGGFCKEAMAQWSGKTLNTSWHQPAAQVTPQSFSQPCQSTYFT